MNKTVVTIGTVAILAVGATVLDPQMEKVEWSHSQGVPHFNTPSGNLGRNQYAMTDTGQVLINVEGFMRSLDETDYPSDLKNVERVAFSGTRYEDVFKDGSKDVISKIDYDRLQTKERVPEKSKLRLAGLADAAIALQASSSVHTSYANSITLALDCGAATDPGVVVFVHNRTPTEITGVTYNSVAMTMEVESVNTSVSGIQTYALVAASTGNNNIVLSNSQYRLHTMYATCLSGTDQSDIVEATPAVTAGYGVAITGSVTSVTDGAWLMTGIATQNDQAFTPDSGETELFDEANSDGNLGQTGISYLVKATAGSETMGWSWTGDTNHTMTLASIKPASGDPPPPATSAEPESVIFFD